MEEYLESGSSSSSSSSGRVDSKKTHDPVEEEEDELFESTLRRAKEGTFFRTYFLKALTSGDDEYISRIFGGLRTNYPPLSQLIQVAAEREARLANPSRLSGLSYFLPHEVAKARRDGRKKCAAKFRREYYYGSGIDQKTLVWPSATYPWTDEASGGVTWLGVHGIDSICVVTRAQDPDVRRAHRYLKFHPVEKVLPEFRKTAISEIEDFAFSSPKPFGVVSVVLGTDDSHDGSGLTASSIEYDKSKAIEFLQEKMKTMNKEAFTVDETIKTAISAFQHLFETEFKANDIGVCVMDPKYFVKTGEHTVKDIYVKHLEMDEIEGHLTAINELAGSQASFDRMIPPSLPTYLPPSLPVLGYSF